MTKELFIRLFQYSNWANFRILGLLVEQPRENESARKLFSHLLAGEKVWMARLHGQDSSSLAIWPNLSLDECATLIEQNNAAWKQFLDDMVAIGLDGVIAYKNSKGQIFSTPVRDILTHVAFHESYHRGQITTVIRNTGGEPVNTDFITFIRDTT